MGVLLDVVVADGVPLVDERLSNRVRHRLSGVPHAVEDDDGALLCLAARPLFIALDDLRDMGTPDNAMSRGDHFHVEPVQCLECRLCLCPVREENVGVVFFRLLAEDSEVILVVEALARCQMLPERVVREENLLLRAVGDHAVGPVQHRGRDELQGALAERDTVACLDGLIGELSIVGAQPLQSVRRTRDDLCARREGGDEGDAVGVIWLHVIGDDAVDLRRIDHGGDAREHLLLKAVFDRINQSDRIVDDEVGVV